MNFLYYTLIRIGIMAVAAALCILLGISPLLSGIFAVLIGFAVSYLAFPKLHLAAGRDLAKILPGTRRARTPKVDEQTEMEDSYVDEQLRREGREI